jgi:uncharacterized protein HemY
MKTRLVWILPLLFGIMAGTGVSPGQNPVRCATMPYLETDVRDGIVVACLVIIVLVVANELAAWSKPKD